MERLTERDSNGTNFLVCREGCNGGPACFECEQKAIDRLAAYEDFVEQWKLTSIEDASRIFRRINALGGTDLMGQYRDLGPINHLRSLVQAEKDGRLVVLPCKVGDTVWTNIAIVGDRYKSADRPYPVEVVFIGIGEDKGFFHVQYSNGRIFPFDFDKIGKTVFLTHEEADAELKKREEAGNETD